MLRSLAGALLWACCSAIASLASVAPPTATPASSPQAARYFEEKWMAADGLPASSILGIARTTDGALWVGTSNGIARFDGVSFEKFTYKLPGQGIAFVTAGPGSQLYIGTWQGGLVTIRDHQMHVFGKREGLQDMRVSIILPVGEDEAWFGTTGGFLYHYIHGSIRTAASRVPFGDSIWGLTRTRDSKIWLGTSGGIYLLQGSRFEHYHPKIPLPVMAVFDLATAEDGSIFAATDIGLFRIRGDQWRSWTTKDGLPSDRVQVLAAGSRNQLWIGTVAGLALLENATITRLKVTACNVFSLLPEHDGSVWFGCSDPKGLHRLRHRAVNLLSVSGRLPDMAITSLVEDRTGTIWMASPHGLIQWRGGRAVIYTRKDGLLTNDIYELSVAPDDSIWIATENGFARMKWGQLRVFRSPTSSLDDPIDTILQDRHGTLWIGAKRGLFRIHGDDQKFEMVPGVRPSVLSLREDRKGNIWAATNGNGLFRFSADGATHFTQECGIASNVVVDIAEIEDGSMWVATDKGLSRIKYGKCATLRAEDGVTPEKIFAMGYDGQGHLWLKTGGGVLAVDIAQANRVINGEGGNLRTRFLGRDDGFGEELVSITGMNSVVRHSSGEMWFPMSNGVGRVNPEVLRTQLPDIHPEVTRVTSEKGDHDVPKPLVMEPGDRRLQFSYSAPALIGAKTLQFRYRLAGFETAWQVPRDSRTATYTSLPPGTYQFQVSARRPFEPWTELTHPLALRVLPHYYQTWWWYTLLTFVSLSLALALYRFRLLAVRRQNAALMAERLRERSALARELHDTLAQGMLGIHIQIEAAQQLLENNPQAVRKHLENVGRIAREASVDTRRSIATLRSQDLGDSSLRNLLLQTASRFEKDCDIPLARNFGDDLPSFSPEVSHEISRIVEEALANVRRHSGARRSLISVHTADRVLLIEVRDDGSGFEMGTAGAGHYGILGMRERALNIHSRLRVSSAIGEGTSVVLEVPFHPSLNRQIFFRGRSLVAFGKRILAQNGKY